MLQQGPQPWPKSQHSVDPSAVWAEQDVSSKSCRSQSPAFPHTLERATLVTGTPRTAKHVCLPSGKAHGYLGRMQVLIFQDKGNKFSLRRSTGRRVWQPGDTGGAHVPGNRKPAWGYLSARVSQVPLLTPGKGHSSSSASQTQTSMSPPFHYAADTRS